MALDGKKAVWGLISQLSKEEANAVYGFLKKKKSLTLEKEIFQFCSQIEDGSLTPTFLEKAPNLLNRAYKKLFALIIEYLVSERQILDETHDLCIKLEVCLSKGLIEYGISISILPIRQLLAKEDFDQLGRITRLFSSLSLKLPYNSKYKQESNNVLFELRRARVQFEEVSIVKDVYFDFIANWNRKKEGGLATSEESEIWNQALTSLPKPKFSKTATCYFWYIIAYFSRERNSFDESQKYMELILNTVVEAPWIEERINDIFPNIHVQAVHDFCKNGDFQGAQNISMTLHSLSLDKSPDYKWKYLWSLILLQESFPEHSRVIKIEQYFQENRILFESTLTQRTMMFTCFAIVRYSTIANAPTNFRYYFNKIYTGSNSKSFFEIHIFTKLFEMIQLLINKDFGEAERLAENSRKILEYSPLGDRFFKTKYVILKLRTIAKKIGENFKDQIEDALHFLDENAGQNSIENEYFNLKEILLHLANKF